MARLADAVAAVLPAEAKVAPGPYLDAISEVIAAAARVLAERKEPKAAATLFNFLPSISADAFLEEEILASVGRLTIQPGKVDTLLLNGTGIDDQALAHLSECPSLRRVQVRRTRVTQEGIEVFKRGRGNVLVES